MIACNRGFLGVTLGVTWTGPVGVTPMALSDTAIRAAKRSSKQFKLYDEGGLFLIVKPSGGKLWRLK
ncbi:MAG: Arm DNA-binding domain-containing protein, partial [Rhizomicrobium sp.]